MVNGNGRTSFAQVREPLLTPTETGEPRPFRPLINKSCDLKDPNLNLPVLTPVYKIEE